MNINTILRLIKYQHHSAAAALTVFHIV